MDFSPGRIKELRKERSQKQVEFGKEIYDLEDEHMLQVYVSKLETGSRAPNSAVRRTLQRMEEGEI